MSSGKTRQADNPADSENHDHLKLRLGLSQGQLGHLLGERLGRAWPRQAVSAAEQGKRSFPVAELFTLAHALKVSIGQLLTPPPGIETVEIGPGIHAERDVITLALVPAMAVDKPQEELQETFSRLLLHVRQLSRAADDVHQDMDVMQRLAMAMQGPAGAEEARQ